MDPHEQDARLATARKHMLRTPQELNETIVQGVPCQIVTLVVGECELGLRDPRASLDGRYSVFMVDMFEGAERRSIHGLPLPKPV